MARRILLWGLALPIVLLAGLVTALWMWTGSDESLALALQRAARYLPPGQTLEVEGVEGSLRHGGRIARLRWQQDGLTVEARQLDVAWEPRSLLDRRLQVNRVHVGHLAIDDQGPATPAVMPSSLMLPFYVDLAFVVDKLLWSGSPKLEATALSGRYVFDSVNHRLDVGSVHISQGNYQVKLVLAAAAPLALDAHVQGQLTTTVPGSTQTLALGLNATAQGNLAGNNPELALQARLQPNTPEASAPSAVATQVLKASQTQASVVARLRPFQAQPVASASATFVGIDLAALWPDAPKTLLTGKLDVQPVLPKDGAMQAEQPAWQAQGEWTNALSGAWDQHRLPLDSAQAALSYRSDQWIIQSLSAKMAGGQVQMQGELASHGVGWQGQATLTNINPASLHTRLAAARVNGQVRAVAVPQGVDFEAGLQPAPQQPPASKLKGLQGLRLKSVNVKGQWANATLTLPTLHIQTDDASLSGSLVLQPGSQAAQGQLHLSLPGGQADAQGAISPRTGAGQFALAVSDAALASRWLATLPGMPVTLASTLIEGRAELGGQWQGGWQQPIGAQNPALRLELHLKAPRLDLAQSGPAPAQALHLRDLAVQAAGTLASLALSIDGKLQAASREFALQAQGKAARRTQGDWQASIDLASLRMSESGKPGVWLLQTLEPVSINWTNGPTQGTLDIGASQASLSGPLSGAARLSWKAARWRGTGAAAQIQTQGQVSGLPMAWLAWFGLASLEQAGLSGDMVFDGEWKVSATDTLKVSASLVRRSGDLRVLLGSTAPGEGPGFGIDAGVKDARLTLTAEGEALRLALQWDSLRAGQLQAEFSTRLTRGTGGEGWQWAADAPLAGAVRAQMPQVGVWSVLAPPGWRIRGTLDASLALAGTRQSPQWGGTLYADDLALRSIADGVEFSQGQLRSVLNGQRLEINSFTLQGATWGGSGGGVLSARGFAVWTPDAAGARIGLPAIRVELDARAQSLRLSARADRRLAVSGDLQVRLADARWVLRGALKVEQALLILPDETAPRLGSDVFVKVPARTGGPDKPGQNTTASAPAISSASQAARIVHDVDLALDMGSDFRVQGRGLSTRLEGAIRLAASGADALPRVTGALRTVRGTYKAYGQQLAIDEGQLQFTGAFDNPALNILAIRPNLAVRVGVQITGTALAPHVRLYADPDLPEAEKLSWLVLGRGAANGGAEAAVLQQAAMALLGGNGKGLSGGLAEALGLDELSFRGGADNADGTTTSATVTLGKRLSRDFYVAYERSLAGTLGTVYIFYDLSRRFTLRAQSGDQSAIDLIFTIPYD